MKTAYDFEDAGSGLEEAYKLNYLRMTPMSLFSIYIGRRCRGRMARLRGVSPHDLHK